jgi:hypothetical protein
MNSRFAFLLNVHSAVKNLERIPRNKKNAVTQIIKSYLIIDGPRSQIKKVDAVKMN